MDLPPLLQLYHEAIQSLLHAEKLSECLTLCDQVIISYKSKQGDTLYNNHNVSIRSPDCLQRVNGVSSQDHDNTLNTSDVKNNNANDNNNVSVQGTDGEIARSMKRKRSDSGTSTPVTVSRRNNLIGQNVSLRNDLIGQDVSCDSTRGSCVGGESRQLEYLDCDVVALKCKAEVLVKMGEITDALECLERYGICNGKVQCNPFITQLIITQIWIYHSHVVAPKFVTMEFYKGIIGKSFFYNSFVKLSLYNTVHL